MGLIDHDEEVLGEVIEECIRRVPRVSVCKVTRVVLDAGAVAHLLHHLKVVVRTLLETLRLEQLPCPLEFFKPLCKLRADVRHGNLHVLILGDVVGRRKDHGMQTLTVDLTRHRVKLDDALYLVAEHLDAHAAVVVPRREDLDHIAAHAKTSALECDVVAFVADGDELLQNCLARDRLSLVHGEHHLMIALGRAETVDAGHARDDNHVAPLEQ